jgi:hypothetical protein
MTDRTIERYLLETMCPVQPLDSRGALSADTPRALRDAPFYVEEPRRICTDPSETVGHSFARKSSSAQGWLEATVTRATRDNKAEVARMGHPQSPEAKVGASLG